MLNKIKALYGGFRRIWKQDGFRQAVAVSINYLKKGKDDPEMFINTLRGAISVKRPFNIIQVGANDGKHNDPIYEFVKKYKDYTNIILVEPIDGIIPKLKDNYAYHPSSEIVNKAIGDQKSGSIRLYGVKQNYWEDINTGYGEDWPNYRIPTGVTTKNKDQLLQWVSRNVKSEADPENIIKKFDVEIEQPSSIINNSQILDDVQLLQVDAEGMDDEIVYSFFKADIYPNIINIESKYLSQKREKEYDKKLQAEGYDIYNYTFSEKLAIL